MNYNLTPEEVAFIAEHNTTGFWHVVRGNTVIRGNLGDIAEQLTEVLEKTKKARHPAKAR